MDFMMSISLLYFSLSVDMNILVLFLLYINFISAIQASNKKKYVWRLQIQLINIICSSDKEVQTIISRLSIEATLVTTFSTLASSI